MSKCFSQIGSIGVHGTQFIHSFIHDPLSETVHSLLDSQIWIKRARIKHRAYIFLFRCVHSQSHLFSHSAHWLISLSSKFSPVQQLISPFLPQIWSSGSKSFITPNLHPTQHNPTRLYRIWRDETNRKLKPNPDGSFPSRTFYCYGFTVHPKVSALSWLTVLIARTPNKSCRIRKIFSRDVLFPPILLQSWL